MTRFTRLRRWFSRRGFRLKQGQRYMISDGYVHYRPHDSPETIVRGLLHEAGHVLFCRTAGWEPPISDVEHIREEIEAWHRGWKLGRRLRFRMDPEAWLKDYRESVLSHIRALD